MFCMQVEIFQNVYKFEVTEEALWYREEKLWGGSRDNLEETMEKNFLLFATFFRKWWRHKGCCVYVQHRKLCNSLSCFLFSFFLTWRCFWMDWQFFLSLNFDLLPRASVTRIKLNSLDALVYIFLHLSIVIQDARDPWHTMCFREKK